MTVAQLIASLDVFPQDADVLIDSMVEVYVPLGLMTDVEGNVIIETITLGEAQDRR